MEQVLHQKGYIAKLKPKKLKPQISHQKLKAHKTTQEMNFIRSSSFWWKLKNILMLKTNGIDRVLVSIQENYVSHFESQNYAHLEKIFYYTWNSFA